MSTLILCVKINDEKQYRFIGGFFNMPQIMQYIKGLQAVGKLPHDQSLELRIREK